MQAIEFSSEELEVLREILQHTLNETNVEAFRTDAHDFKAMLKHRIELLERILARVSATPVTL